MQRITLSGSEHTIFYVCAAWRVDPLWGAWGHLQDYAERPAEELLEKLRDMLRSRPEQLRVLLLDHLSPAVAELLTGKMEERAAQDDGVNSLSPGNGDTLPMLTCSTDCSTGRNSRSCQRVFMTVQICRVLRMVTTSPGVRL